MREDQWPRRRKLVAVTATLLLAIVSAACSTPAASARPPSAGSPGGSTGSTFDAAEARSYCTTTGGALVTRIATWNTNAGQQAQLRLAGEQQFCEFESSIGGQASTRISVDLVTLASSEPTMAGVAYLSKVPPLLPPQPSANPAEYNCTKQLGGAASFGNTNVAGGWMDASQPVFVLMNYCVFADGSAIDEFGIFYYATGVVRGADLAKLMRYQPNGKLPAMFQPVRS
jgi:putative hemolysin